MSLFKAFLSALGVSSLVACGGGGTEGLPPVVASGPPPADLSEMAGLTFPVQVARLDNPTGLSVEALALETALVEIVDAGTLRLNTPLGMVTLTEAGGNWTGSSGGLDYEVDLIDDLLPFDSHVFGLRISYSHASGGGLAQGVFGYETSAQALQSLIDGDAVIGYSGNSEAVVVQGGSIPITVTGTSIVVVDFGSGAVTGSVFNGGNTTIQIVDGQLSGGTISGAVAVAVPPGETASTDPGSSFVGRIYGQSGFQAGGVFSGTGLLNGNDLDFAGTFAGFD